MTGMQTAPIVIGLPVPGSMAITEDPNLKCHFGDCFYVGTQICQWRNICCRKQKHGGCGKRYCENHAYHKDALVVSRSSGRSHHVHHFDCCIQCGPELDQDIIANNRCRRIICFVNFFILLAIILPSTLLTRRTYYF
jgi:hypothetical protein